LRRKTWRLRCCGFLIALWAFRCKSVIVASQTSAYLLQSTNLLVKFKSFSINIKTMSKDYFPNLKEMYAKIRAGVRYTPNDLTKAKESFRSVRLIDPSIPHPFSLWRTQAALYKRQAANQIKQ
jgi:hypothetical protein